MPRPSINDIFITEGASQAVNFMLKTIICEKNDGVMIPIPQYPLYSASICLNGGTVVPYYLDEKSGWQLGPEELNYQYAKAEEKGVNMKCICIINPGNPTGSVFREDTLQNIIKFAVEKRMVLITDEVYRENIYKDGIKFISTRAVLEKMNEKYKNVCELASVNSVSKGVLGECGLRGGYLYLHNFHENVNLQIYKLKSIPSCSNTIGQMSVEMMCNPPI